MWLLVNLIDYESVSRMVLESSSVGVSANCAQGVHAYSQATAARMCHCWTGVTSAQQLVPTPPWVEIKTSARVESLSGKSDSLVCELTFKSVKTSLSLLLCDTIYSQYPKVFYYFNKMLNAELLPIVECLCKYSFFLLRRSQFYLHFYYKCFVL